MMQEKIAKTIDKTDLRWINSFLKGLGYQDNDKVYLRLIPVKKGGTPKNLYRTYPLKNLPEIPEGHNLFYVVNGQGQKAKDISTAKALFCEFDDIPIDEQKLFFKKFNLPVPTYQIFTGGKSIHHYWVLKEPVPIEDWKILIKDLIDFVGCDKANKDPSRLLRLPFLPYCDKKSGKFTGNSEWLSSDYATSKYTFDELRSAIPNQSDIKSDIKSDTSNNDSSNDNNKELTYSQKEDLLEDILHHIPPKKKGDYDAYRNFLTAIKNEFSEDKAIDISNQLCSNSDDDWVQIIKSSNGNHNIGTIINFGKENGFNYKQWRKDNIHKNSNAHKSYSKGNNQDNNQDDYLPDSNSKTKLELRLIRKHFGDNLRFNSLTNELEFNNQILTDKLDNYYIELSELYDYDFPKNRTYDIIINTAKNNQYHPIKDYLDSLKFDTFVPDNLGKLMFNLDTDIYDPLINKWLVGAVARIYKSGCKLDNMLILQGKQGIGKSLFFRTLFGDEWFTDSLSANLSRDDLMIAHRHWGIEFDELDRITSKKEAGAVKAFISKQRDDFRKPYEKTDKSYPRGFTLCGSCNKSEFLVDETGSRRFWVIPIQSVNIDWVKENRDLIWFTAKVAYENGYNWWLDKESNEAVQELNKQFEVSDVWFELIEKWCEGRDTVMVLDVLTKPLELFDSNHHTKQNQMRVTNILKQLGYEKKRKSIDGKQQRVWCK